MARGSGGGDRGAVGGRERPQALLQVGGALTTGVGEQGPAHLGERDARDAAVGLVAGPHDEALLLEPVDRGGDGGRTHPLDGGEVAVGERAPALEGGEDRALRGGHAVGRHDAAETPGEARDDHEQIVREVGGGSGRHS